ncbi:hypothetical protein L6452_01595 [Arctium lappa]|uniref:Uncharacterized protein n=1 Tax=Arctium lappa TaxID=4217 RepID=A0ACB9FHY9_ARCLA|nr:hypothetical protein L6452_01595 [Arctium lappa]
MVAILLSVERVVLMLFLLDFPSPHEDEKYRLGYGVAGKGVKLPWYMTKRPNGDDKGIDKDDDCDLEVRAVT